MRRRPLAAVVIATLGVCLVGFLWPRSARADGGMDAGGLDGSSENETEGDAGADAREGSDGGTTTSDTPGLGAGDSRSYDPSAGTSGGDWRGSARRDAPEPEDDANDRNAALTAADVASGCASASTEASEADDASGCASDDSGANAADDASCASDSGGGCSAETRRASRHGSRAPQFGVLGFVSAIQLRQRKRRKRHA